MKLIRKCTMCGKVFSLTDDGLVIGGKSYHLECYIEKTISGKNKLTLDDVKLKANEIRNKTLAQIAKEQDEKKTSKNKSDDKSKKPSVQLDFYLMDRYGLIKLSCFYYKKINDVYNGVGMKYGIPSEHLLDMWKRKESYLDKVQERNVTLGKDIRGMNLLLYDLSILISKYPDYLTWLNKQSVIDSNIDNTTYCKIMATNVSDQQLDLINNTINDQENILDLASMIDDTFFSDGM